jgi:2,3-bisphosphoglycerate-independent phosphoglycerate mutase
MDRDQRWDRVAQAYELLVDGRAPYTAATAIEGLEAAYARGETDEFVKPTAIVAQDVPATMRDGDVVVFMNFRADRAREITRALTDPAFSGFRATACRTSPRMCASRLTATSSGAARRVRAANDRNSFGEYLSNLGLTQLRIAETEKYAHVTYFFNGGVEAVYPGEDRILVPSPKGRDRTTRSPR